jgi:glyoxylase-like metal-dependent hydrolase (beta-lactamase superfamily II)
MREDMDSFQAGGMRVTRVPELELAPFPVARLFPDWREDLLDGCAEWLDPAAMTPDRRAARLSVHAWLVRTPKRVLLVDTGAGNGKDRPHAPYFDHLDLPFPERLAAAGAPPEAVDLVLLTHLHVDHVGWNTRLADGRWVPTFPNARHAFCGAELAYYTDPANLNERNRTSFLCQQDSVLPVVAAGLADFVAADGSGAPALDAATLRFLPMPGHSPHHMAIVLEAPDGRLLFTGDLLHHPLQVRHPELNTLFDAFPEEARRSRRRILEYAAETGALVCGGHLPGRGAGRVRRAGAGFAWLPA